MCARARAGVNTLCWCVFCLSVHLSHHYKIRQHHLVCVVCLSVCVFIVFVVSPPQQGSSGVCIIFVVMRGECRLEQAIEWTSHE